MRDFTRFCSKSLKSNVYFTLTARINLDQPYFKSSMVNHMWLVAMGMDGRALEYFNIC